MHVMGTTLTKILWFMLEKHKSGHLVTRETFRRKPLEISTSLNILQQDFRTIEVWAVRFICHKVLILYQLVLKLPTDYLQKLMDYQHYIIYMHQNYISKDIWNISLLFVCYLALQLSKRVKINTGQNSKSWKTEYNYEALSSGWWGGRDPLLLWTNTIFWLERFTVELCLNVFRKVGWQKKSWSNWVSKMWGRMPVAHLKKRGMLGSDAFKSHLTEKVTTLN